MHTEVEYWKKTVSNKQSVMSQKHVRMWRNGFINYFGRDLGRAHPSCRNSTFQWPQNITKSQFFASGRRSSTHSGPIKMVRGHKADIGTTGFWETRCNTLTIPKPYPYPNPYPHMLFDKFQERFRHQKDTEDAATDNQVCHPQNN